MSRSSSSSSLPVPWMPPSLPNCLFLGVSGLLLLPYLYLINVLLIHGTSTFRSTYYSLLLSRGIVDVSSAVIYFLATSLREFSGFRDFFWNSQHSYLPTFCYAQVYFFHFAQLVALLLVPVERLLAVFSPRGIQLISSGPSCISSILIWILPLCLAWSMLIQLDCSFDTYENLYLNVPGGQDAMALFMVFVASVIVAVVSLTIFGVIFYKRQEIRPIDLKDTRLSACQFLPLGPLLVYFGYNWTRKTAPLRVFEADSPYPIYLALLSYFNVALLLLDHKIRQKINGTAAIAI